MTKKHPKVLAKPAFLSAHPEVRGLVFSLVTVLSVVLIVGVALYIPYLAVLGWVEEQILQGHQGAKAFILAVMPYGSLGFNVAMGLAGLGLVAFVQGIYLNFGRKTRHTPILLAGMVVWSAFALLCYSQIPAWAEVHAGAFYMALLIVFVYSGMAGPVLLLLAALNAIDKHFS